MLRRDFIALLGGATVWPVTAASAQQSGRSYRIGVFSGAATNRIMGPAYDAFLDDCANLVLSRVRT